MKRSCLGFVLAMALILNAVADRSTYVAAGVCGGTWDSMNLVRSVLHSAGIECSFDGSVGMGILVPPDKQDIAINLLFHDPRLEGNWLMVLNKKTGYMEERKSTHQPSSEQSAGKDHAHG